LKGRKQKAEGRKNSYQFLLPFAFCLLPFLLAGCKTEKTAATVEPQTFTITVYPGSEYLSQLSEVTKRAFTVIHPNQTPPPVAIYDTDAPLEKVAEFYAKTYGVDKIAPDPTNNMSAAKPPAYYRIGDLQTDVKAIDALLKQLKMNTDVSKAQGKYRAAEIEPKTNRPRVTIQRPYFDVTKSQVIDRTMILMSP
jgi:hypothetical protein